MQIPPISGAPRARSRLRLLARLYLIDPSIRGRPRAYLFQTLLAGVSLGVILLFEENVAHGAILASVASSVFTVFVVPHSVAASGRRVVGGHLVGVAVGASASAIVVLTLGDVSPLDGWQPVVAVSASVAVAMLLMAVTNTEHPPAAGTTFGLVAFGANSSAILFVVTAAVLLTAIRVVLKGQLVNLL